MYWYVYSVLWFSVIRHPFTLEYSNTAGKFPLRKWRSCCENQHQWWPVSCWITGRYLPRLGEQPMNFQWGPQMPQPSLNSPKVMGTCHSQLSEFTSGSRGIRPPPLPPTLEAPERWNTANKAIKSFYRNPNVSWPIWPISHLFSEDCAPNNA